MSQSPLSALRRLALILLAGMALGGASAARAQESVYQGCFPGGTGSLSNVDDFEANSGRKMSIINYFTNWDDANGPRTFQTTLMNNIRARGSIPLYTWQPQGASPDATYQLDNITAGNFDPYIIQWALAAKAWGHPFFLRFAHEMNGSWYPWSPGINGNTTSDYIAAWRHVHDIFTEYGVTNVTWVWCPATNYSGSTALNKIYPGDNYVDWMSLDSYNRITNSWADFSSRSSDTLTDLIALAPGKPIMVAETGCHPGDANNDKGQWFRNALANYLKYSMPSIKAWVYFNGNNPDGNDWRITTSPTDLAGYQFGIGLSYYSDNKYGSITDSPIQPLVNDATSTDTLGPFVSIVNPAVNRVQVGVATDLHVLASDKSGVTKIEYSINGVVAHTESISPYDYFWTVPAGTGKTYTIVAKAYDGAGNTSTSTLVAVSQNPPAAPTGVAASDGAYTDKVRVTWSAATAAVGYQVWRNTTNDTSTATQISASLITGTLFDDATVPYTTPYYYWVKTVDNTGPGAFSAVDSGYRVLPPAPAAPTGVFATDGVYNSSTSVGWSATSGATSYDVWRNTVSNTATATKLNSSPITDVTYSDATGAYALKYYYWVRAVNDGGTSPFSTPGSGYRGNLPTISAISDQLINANAGTGPIAFTVGDTETPAASLILSAASSNPALAPVANVTFGGSGANRTVTVTPVANQRGSATITVTVTDADGGQSSDAFKLTVNALPTISSMTDVTTNKNTATGALAFTVSDAETTASALTVSAVSSNSTLVPTGAFAFGGSAGNRTLTVTPAANQVGSASISVTVSDGIGTATAGFTLRVIDPTLAYWTAMNTGSTLNWSNGANWSGGVAPQSSVSTVSFLDGSTLPAGAISSNNDNATPYGLNTLTLSGAGPANAAATVNITGGQFNFGPLPDGTAPTVNLAAAPGAGAPAAFTYNVAVPLTLNAVTAFQGDGGATFAMTGSIGGTGGITKTGASTLVLGGANTYLGRTIISGGTNSVLRVTNAAGLGTNGTLQTNTGATTPIVQLHLDGSGSNGVIPMSNAFGGNSGIATTIDVANNGGAGTGNTIQLNGVTTGWGNGVTLNVTGANGYGLYLSQIKDTGGSAGVETFNPTTAPLTIGAFLGAAKATSLVLDGTNAGNAINGAIVDGSAVVSLTKSNTSAWTLAGDSTYSGPTSILAGTLQIGAGGTTGSIAAGSAVSGADGAILAFNRSDSSTFGSVISGAVALKQSGTGNTTLTGANTFTGTTTVWAGVLTAGSNTALGTTDGATLLPSNGGALALTGGITVAEPLTMNGKTAGDHLINASGNNSLTGAITLQTGGNNYFVRSDADKLTIAAPMRMVSSSAAKTLSFYGNGNTEVSGAIGSDSGTFGISKTGAGTLTLSGPNTYTGPTVGAAGVLAINSSLATTSGLTIGPAATLTGSGAIGAATTVNGTHAPGAGVGAQTFNAPLSYGAASHLAWSLAGNTVASAGTNFGLVNAGSVSVASGAVVDVIVNGAGSAVNFSNSFWQASHTWTVLSGASITGGAFTLGAVTTDGAGRVGTAYGLFSVQQTGTAVNLGWTPFSPVDAWRYANFGANWNNPAIAGDNADPDGDGLSNLLEYALGEPATMSNGSGIVAGVAGGYCTMTYPLARSATDIVVQPQWSTDLVGWSSANVSQQLLVDGPVQTIQASVPLNSNARMYLRLRVTRP